MDKETDNIVQLAKQCPVDYPDREFCGLARDPVCVELVAALQAAGYVHLAKAAVCGISWSRRISAGFDLAYLEADAAEPGWSWDRPIVCTCPVLDGHEVTGSSCPLHGLPPAPCENTRGVNMGSVERRLADAKLGAAIDYAIDCLPENYAVRVVLARGRYAVQLLCDGRPGPCFKARWRRQLSPLSSGRNNAGRHRLPRLAGLSELTQYECGHQNANKRGTRSNPSAAARSQNPDRSGFHESAHRVNCLRGLL